MRTTFVAIVLATMALSLGGCTALVAERPIPTCLDRSAEVDAIAPTTENMAKVFSTVVVGTFEGYGEARWNTSTGEQPTASDDLATLIVRPVRVTAETALRGDMAAVNNTRVAGGTIGCNRDTYSSDPQLTQGQRYLFFLGDDPQPGHKDSATMLVGGAWPVTSNGSVQTPLEGTSDLVAIQKVLDEVPRLAN